MLVFTPLQGLRMNLKKKINIARGVKQKNIYKEKNQNPLTLQGVLTYLPIFLLSLHINVQLAY
jgi:hypothetical protein